MRGGLFLQSVLLLCATTPAAAQAAEPPLTVSVMATGLRVADLDRALKFYTDGLGMVVATRLQHGTLTEVILSFQTDRSAQSNNAGIILLYDPGKQDAASPGAPAAPGKIVLRVSDIQALNARLVAAGFQAGAIGGAGSFKVMHIKDPDGFSYEIVQPPVAR